MSNKTFTDKEMEILVQNQYIQSISKKSITYTDEFKREFIVENKKGKNPREIFEEHGFDIEVLECIVFVLQAKDGVQHIEKMGATV